MNQILDPTPAGLYCSSGDFYIDPWRPVKRAVITHAHADHAISGCHSYLCTRDSKVLLQSRIGHGANIETIEYGEVLSLDSVKVSLHPAGHILGSAQVKIDKGGHIWVVSGDYKTENDPTCLPLEVINCHTFITECTFGLPIFKWPPPEQVTEDINSWWRSNREQNRTCILFAYALGKAQRILAGLDASIGPILTHGAVEKINQCYRDTGITLPETQYIGDLEEKILSKVRLCLPLLRPIIRSGCADFRFARELLLPDGCAFGVTAAGDPLIGDLSFQTTATGTD